MNMQMMARSLLVYRLTGSAAILGAMSLFNALPMLSLSLFGGVIADRMQKKYVLIAGLIGSALVSLVIALALTLGFIAPDVSFNIMGLVVPSWWILAATALFQGSIMGLMIPSRQSIVPEIVEEEQLMNAISLDVLGMNTLRLTAPALTGFLIEAFDFEAVFYAMTAMYLSGVFFIALMPLTGTIAIRGGRALAEIMEGFRYLRNEPRLLTLLAFTLLAVFFSMPYMMMLPIFAEDILKVGAAGLGVLISVGGIGAITGSLTLASLPNKKRGLMLLVSSFLLGVALVGFSFSSLMPLSLVLMVFVGLGQSGRMTLGNTLIQYYVDDDYRGRVMSIYMMQFGITSFAVFAAGLIAEKVGPQWALGGLAMVLIAVSLLALAFVPRIRNLD
jgi:MFS family permease